MTTQMQTLTLTSDAYKRIAVPAFVWNSEDRKKDNHTVRIHSKPLTKRQLGSSKRPKKLARNIGRHYAGSQKRKRNNVKRTRYLCMPEHSMHSVMPRLMEAHDGSAAPQSQQCSLPVIDRSMSTRLQTADTVDIAIGANHSWKPNSFGFRTINKN